MTVNVETVSAAIDGPEGVGGGAGLGVGMTDVEGAVGKPLLLPLLHAERVSLDARHQGLLACPSDARRLG